MRIAALGAALLCGCAYQPLDDWSRAAAEAGRDVEKDWARYHWYFPARTYEIHASWVTENGYSGPSVKITLAMAAKALTQEGAAYVGALHLEGWKEYAASIAVHHMDSAGRTLPVPMFKVREDFRRTGILVVPNVTKGSTVSVRIVHGPYSAVNVWELALHAQVPVLRSEVRLTASKHLAFATKAYNGLRGPEIRSNGTFKSPTRIWTAERILPLAGLPYADGMTARPRLLLVNSGNFRGTRYPDWGAVAVVARLREYERGMLDSDKNTRAQAKKLAQGPDETANARRLLAWVQDNITVTHGKAERADLDAVLERRRGSPAQVARVYEALCEAAGLRARIVLTRPREWGGLDPETPNPEAAAVPLVLVRAGNRDWAAFPHSGAFPFGDYPSGMAGLMAVSMEDEMLLPLPEPANAVSRMESRQDVSLDGTPTRRAEVELTGPWAAEIRAQWLLDPETDPQDACRRDLRGLGFQGSLRECRVSGLEERDKPLRLALILDNTSTRLEDGAFRAWTFPGLFSRPAWFYDSSRAESYWIPSDQVRRETVRFVGNGGKKPLPDFPCRAFEDSVLKVSCIPGGDGVSMTRQTELRRGFYPASVLRARHAALAGLDRASDTRVVVR